MFKYIANTTSGESASGIGALGLNWKSFLFQLITFGIIVFLLNKFVVKSLYKVIDARQKEIEAGLDKSKKAGDELAKAGAKAEQIVKDARVQAEELIHGAQNDATNILKDVESKATHKAERIVSEARSHLAVDIEKAHKELLKENAKLISKVSAEIIGKKLDDTADAKLIKDALEVK